MAQQRPVDNLAPVQPVGTQHGSAHYPFPGGMFANAAAGNPFAIANPAAAPRYRNIPTVTELFHAFKRRWLLGVFVGCFIACLAAVAIWMAMPSGKHQAQAVIQVKAQPHNRLNQGGWDRDEFDRFKDEQLQLMKKRDFLLRVINRPGVADVPAIAKLTPEERVKLLEDLLTFKWEHSEFLHVRVNGDDEQVLKVLLSSFVNTFINEGRTMERKRLEDREKFLKDSIKAIDDQMNATDLKIKEANRQFGAGGPNTVQSWNTQLTFAEGKFREYEEKKTSLDVQINLIENELKAPSVTIQPETLQKLVDNDPEVISTKNKLQELRAYLTDLRKKVVEGSPLLVEPELQLKKLEQDYIALMKSKKPFYEKDAEAQQRVDFLTQLRRLKTEHSSVVTQLNTFKSQIDSLAEKIAKYESADLGVTRLQSEMKGFQERKSAIIKDHFEIEKLLQLKDDDVSRLFLVEDAVFSENKNLKQKMFLASVVAIISLVCVLFVISYLEWRNRRVDGVDQVVTELGMRVIGTIPAFPSRASLRSGAANENQNWRFILNESVNSTRTMLLHEAKNHNMQVLMVTSAMQGEGKTSLSSQLATSMATAGLRTLILDCDLRNPSMQKLFDIPVAPGCSEILLQEIDIAETVQATTVPNLWIIPAGHCNHRVVAALAQGHPLEQLFQRLRGQFDIIIVDTCPILPVADTLLVAQHVDGVVFSILQDVSQLPKVQNATERLTQLNIPLMGAVINGIKPDTQAYGYNYVKQLPA